VAARERLKAKGVACWMDVDGGMSRNIYDSMAEGVTNASVVVCFMTAAYQASENCRLELQFAKQLGAPIVPVVTQAGYKASGWLALITAGALWVPLFDPALLDTGVEQLAQQIRLAAPEENAKGQPAAEEVDGGDELFSVAEMRGELERLRADLQESGRRKQRPAAASANGQCGLPAGVPELPVGLRVSAKMRELATALLSPAAGTRVGFVGMGGIGGIIISIGTHGFTRRQRTVTVASFTYNADSFTQACACEPMPFFTW
jgi:hypothetical protein